LFSTVPRATTAMQVPEPAPANTELTLLVIKHERAVRMWKIVSKTAAVAVAEGRWAPPPRPSALASCPEPVLLSELEAAMRDAGTS
jgi:hypothetical protein